MVETWEWSGPLTPLAVTALAVMFGVLFALVALWIALPFALFGIRRHLREIQSTLDAIRLTLEGLHQSLAAPPSSQAAQAGSGHFPPGGAAPADPAGDDSPPRCPGAAPPAPQEPP